VPAAEQVVIVGGGHNGLVAAFYLAKAGVPTLVLERREVVGGGAVTEELHPGFRCPTLDHAIEPLPPQISRDLPLNQRGLKTITPDVRIFAPDRNGRPLFIFQDAERTGREIENLSARDAKSYLAFKNSFRNIGAVLAPLMAETPPEIKHLDWEDAWRLGKLGLNFRRLERKDAFRLLRWAPMAVADLVAEWFETELLRAVIAARGIHGAFAGPWSAGTSLPLLVQSGLDGQPIAPTVFATGGPGSLTEALRRAAEDAGAAIRTSAGVRIIQIREGKARGVVLDNGDEIAARAVVSNADPQHTFLKLIDPIHLDPVFLQRVRNYRTRGAAAKVNLALSGLPEFPDMKDRADGYLAGRIHIGPDIDYLERAFDAAKYGEYSAKPYMDITIPSMTDPSLAPKGAHVMSIHVQYAPYQLRNGDWEAQRENFGDSVVKALSDYVPNLSRLIVHRQVITPADLERKYGLTGGHIHHGEMSLEQFFAFRPLPGFAQYRTPIDGLYLCGAGAHPGGGLTGLPGANASREILRDLKRSGK